MTLTRLYIFAVLSFLLLFFMMGISVYFLRNIQHSAARIDHRKYTKERLDETYSGLMELEAGSRGFFITGNERLYQTFDPTLKKIRSNLRIIDSLVSNSYEGASDAARLTRLVNRRVDLLVASGAKLRQMEMNTSDTFHNTILEGAIVMDSLRVLFMRMDAREDEMLAKRIIQVKKAQNQTVRALIGFSAVVVLLFALMFHFIFREYRSKRLAFEKLQRSEDRLNATLSVVKDAIINMDNTGRIRAWNAAAERLFGLDPSHLKDTLLADHLLFSGTQREEGSEFPLMSNDLHLFTGKRLELAGLRGNGEEFPIDVNIETYRFHGKDYYVATIRDISEMKEKQQALNDTLYNLERSNQELEQFAYIASHDLQEPLRKIQAFGHRLLTKIGGDDLESVTMYSSKMVRASERMQNLILSLLGFSRISRNQEETCEVDLSQVLRNVLEDLEYRIREENAQIIFDPLPVLPEGREIQLFQLFLNLVGNAIKFKKEERDLVIQIRCSEDPKEKWSHLREAPVAEGIYYQIIVEDNGKGFDMKYHDKIFTIFQRLHGRSEYEGAGIGLAVCQRVCENHGGMIAADSIPDLGSKFYVYLPKRDA